MEFVFHLSGYGDPALDREAEQLMEQRLEAASRKAVPGMWKVTDQLNAYAARGPGREKRIRRYRIYGAVLLALGIFVLVPGLMEPRQLDLILIGALSVLLGLFNLFLPQKRGAKKPGSLAKTAAEEQLIRMRNVDWTGFQICYNEQGELPSRDGEPGTPTAYADMLDVFESDHAWLVVHSPERGLLLQKKDLVSGNPQEFLPYLKEKMKNQAKEKLR